MELTAEYEELNSYIQGRFGQPISLSLAEGGDLKVTYSKRILFKDMHISVGLHFDEVKADEITVSYRGAFGIDSIISGVLSFVTSQLPELAAGIHPEEDHRIRICLSEIEKAKPLVDNIALQAITPCADSLKIEFGLEATGK